jgi:hypothetical protein
MFQTANKDRFSSFAFELELELEATGMTSRVSTCSSR